MDGGGGIRLKMLFLAALSPSIIGLVLQRKYSVNGHIKPWHMLVVPHPRHPHLPRGTPTPQLAMGGSSYVGFLPRFIWCHSPPNCLSHQRGWWERMCSGHTEAAACSWDALPHCLVSLTGFRIRLPCRNLSERLP